MSKWCVTYEAVYFVEADTEQEAIENGIYEHEDLPDGYWRATEYKKVNE